jgi:hypothetical protein
MLLQNLSDNMALAAPNIDEGIETTKGISRRNFGAFWPVNADHGLAYGCTALGVGRDIVEKRHPVCRGKCWGTRLEDGRQLLPSPQDRVIVQEEDQLSQ